MSSLRSFVALRLWLPYLAVLLIAALLPLRPRVDSSARTLLASDPRHLETYDKVHSLMPETVMALVVVRHDAIFSNEGAALIAEMSDALLDVPGCVEVKSLTHSGRPVRQGMGLWIDPFIPLFASAQEWQRLRDFNTRFPMSRNVLVSEDARHAVLLPLFERDIATPERRDAFYAEVRDALEPFRERTESLSLLAFPFVEAEAEAAVRKDLKRYLTLAGVLIVTVLLFTFRSPLLLAYVLTVQAGGMLLTAGLFALGNRAVDLHTGMLFPLIAGVQLTFVIHYLAALQRAARSLTPGAAAAAAFRETAAPAGLAALTTAFGLAILGLSDLSMVADFGRYGAPAVLLVYGFTFLVPALQGRARAASGDVQTGALFFPQRHRKLIFTGAGLLLLLSLPGLPRVRTDVRVVEFIQPGHPVRETIELLDRELGGINIFQVDVDSGRPGGMQTLPMLRFLEQLRRDAAALEGVTDAYAYSQLYIALNQIWDGDGGPEGVLPTNPLRITLFSQLINQSPLLFRDAFVSADLSSSLMILRSRDMPGREYLSMLEEFLAHADSIKPAGVTLTPVHGLHSILEQDRRIVANQTRSLAFSAAGIFALLTLLWRSPKLAGAVLLINVPALLLLFGLMGHSGFALNSVTVMVAAVILGIAVDDGIHWIAAYRAHLRAGFTTSDAAARALAEKLRPMSCTSAILMVCFGLLTLSSFPPVSHFGLLAAAGLLAAWLGAVLLLPALLGSPHHTLRQGNTSSMTSTDSRQS